MLVDTTSVFQTALSQFREVFRGQVILPEDADYGTARLTHSPLQDRFPTLIVRPVDAEDVSQAVRFATAQELTIGVLGGGHSSAGFGIVEGGIVIDLGQLNAVSIDTEARIARAEGGARAGQLLSVAIPQGFVVPFGDSPDVGIGGITLGGGVGWLTRKFGMTIDSLLAVEIVTADGQLLRASETEYPDLFWAVRGGGGNFGIVTAFEFRLHPLGKVLGGSIYLPFTRETMCNVINLSQNAPDELTTISVIMRAFPMPGVPEPFHGKLALVVSPVWVGDLDEGQQVLDGFRNLDDSAVDMTREMSFWEMYEGNSPPPGQYSAMVRSFMADSLDDAAVDALLAGYESTPPNSMAISQFRVLGGAMARVSAEATAFANRSANLLLAVGAIGFPAEDLPANEQWVLSLYDAMKHTSTGAYLNFMDEEGEARIHEAYPIPTYQRLAQVKKQYDPQNRFRRNQNIQPA